MKGLFVFLAFLAGCSLTYGDHVHQCCQNNHTITSNGTCSDGEPLMSSALCAYGAFIIKEHDKEDAFDVEEDGTLRYRMFKKTTVEPDKFCIGKFEDYDGQVALVCFLEEDDGTESEWKFLIRIIGCSISIVSLLLTLIVYIILPNLRDLQGKCLMCSIFSLMLSFLFLTSIQLYTTYSTTACVLLAFVIYFWFTCTFTWLNVISINMMLTVMSPKWFTNCKFAFLIYSIYGWGLPILLLVITLVTHYLPGDHIQPHFGESKCWFESDNETWAFFYGPISILLVANLIMFIATIAILIKKQKLFAAPMLRSHKFRCMLYMKLFFIIGILWLFEPLSAIPGISNWRLWIFTDCLNTIQGILIFLLLVVFRNRVRRDLARKGIVCCKFMESWSAIPDDDCEELEEEKTENITYLS